MANEIKALNIGGSTYTIQPEYSDVAGKVNSLLWAGTKSYDGSSEVTITAADLGLSSALKYIGITSTSITDGSSTTSLTIGGSTYTIPTGPDAPTGQVVFYDDKEFVWNGSQWEFLGDDRSFKVVQSPVSDPVAEDVTSTTFIDAISQDANGLITATKKKLPSYLSTGGGTISGSLAINYSAGGDQVLTLRSKPNDASGACRIAFYDGSNAFQGYAMTGWGNLVLAHRSHKQIGVGDSGIWCSTDNGTTINTLLHSGNYSSYALPLSGGTISGNLAISGTCSALSGFFETSDSRLKDFKDPIKVDLDKLSKLTKAYFTFKNDPEKMHLGVSAQEIQEIYPEIVNENEEGFLSVDYAKLSVIALTAVDELNSRLNSIEERLSKLEK